MMSVLLSSMKWLLQGHQVARLLGLFLLVTAGLKIHGLIVDPYGQENFLALPWLQVLTIEVEVLLGLWLLSGVQLRWALIASLLLFSVFACLSFTLAWQGQTDCGCFGKVKVNPWWTFVIDAIVATLICVMLKRRQEKAQYEIRLARLSVNSLQIIISAAMALGLIGITATWYYGDLWVAIANIRGESLDVNPKVVLLGNGYAGEFRYIEVQVTNYCKKPITIIGGTVSCSCAVIEDLPVTIEPGGVKTVNVVMRYPGEFGNFAHRFALFTNSNRAVVVTRFSGTVAASQPDPKSSTNNLPKVGRLKSS